MAVEQRESFHHRREIRIDFPETLQRYHVRQNLGLG